MQPNSLTMKTNTHTLKKHLYETHYKYVRYVVLHGLQHELAEEITSQTFEKAFNAIERGMFKDVNEKAWLSRIAKNTLIDQYRRRQRRELPIYVHDDGTEMQIEDVHDDELDETKKENLKEIYDATTCLSSAHKRSFLRHYRDGVSVRDIAEESELSINTILGHLRYARINIRKHLRII